MPLAGKGRYYEYIGVETPQSKKPAAQAKFNKIKNSVYSNN